MTHISHDSSDYFSFRPAATTTVHPRTDDDVMFGYVNQTLNELELEMERGTAENIVGLARHEPPQRIVRNLGIVAEHGIDSSLPEGEKSAAGSAGIASQEKWDAFYNGK